MDAVQGLKRCTLYEATGASERAGEQGSFRAVTGAAPGTDLPDAGGAAVAQLHALHADHRVILGCSESFMKDITARSSFMKDITAPPSVGEAALGKFMASTI